ncbi:hypothetical protein [Caulobacter sp. UC70_42]|uniref:hypothetical protein n=1 Tax=Caulobacter sp. UC70_42 TaxID=3374551 RepID=UPI0037579642
MSKYRETDLGQRMKPDSFFEDLISDRTPFAAGTSREVYEVPDDASVVIKKAKHQFPGSNMAEWFVWSGVRQTPLEPLFAEILLISASCKYIMMARLDPITQGDHANIPPMPIWLNDRKPDAFGKLGDRIKAMDYGVLNYPELFVQTVEPLPMQVAAKNNRERGISGG